jgi:hypothetical protein
MPYGGALLRAARAARYAGAPMSPQAMQRAVIVVCWAVLGGLAALLTESTALGVAIVVGIAAALAWWALGRAGDRR